MIIVACAVPEPIMEPFTFTIEYAPSDAIGLLIRGDKVTLIPFIFKMPVCPKPAFGYSSYSTTGLVNSQFFIRMLIGKVFIKAIGKGIIFCGLGSLRSLKI